MTNTSTLLYCKGTYRYTVNIRTFPSLRLLYRKDGKAIKNNNQELSLSQAISYVSGIIRVYKDAVTTAVLQSVVKSSLTAMQS